MAILIPFGGAIQLAGEVKVRGDRRRARSDWMAIERERGISVSSAVMSFEHEGLAFNLLDTSGHQDFSEDTYRTLTAVDSAVMVLDAAKGIEEQTRKLFEVCRLRDVSIVTFINKLDREARDPFDLLDEIEQSLALDVTRLPGRSAWAATFSAPTACSPMPSCCSNAASTTGHGAGPRKRGRHHRHPQPRQPQDRRHLDRRPAGAHRWYSEP